MTSQGEFEFFPRLILKIVKTLTRDERWQKMYVKYMSLVNYAVVFAIGLGINMAIQHWLAIIVFFFWNWLFTVGPLGYLWGFSSKSKTAKKEEPTENG